MPPNASKAPLKCLSIRKCRTSSTFKLQLIAIKGTAKKVLKRRDGRLQFTPGIEMIEEVERMCKQKSNLIEHHMAMIARLS